MITRQFIEVSLSVIIVTVFGVSLSVKLACDYLRALARQLSLF